MSIPKEVSEIKLPAKDSHKGQNGKLLIIGGSKLFHAASLWALTVASRMVDMVHYASVPENNQIVHELKTEFRDGIVIPREQIPNYIEEDDCVLIGPGMTRDEETKQLTDQLLKKYPHKQWVIDAGALQMMNLELIPQNAILTPHLGEFSSLMSRSHDPRLTNLGPDVPQDEQVKLFAQRYSCIVLVKSVVDIAVYGGKSAGRLCAPGEIRHIAGGNAGMTKGGTGDVLAGLIAALACKNDPWVATVAGAYINKRAGDALFERVAYYFNASDLADEIPNVMKELITSKATQPR
jgi:NAD(P)H-hydrate epimerase